MSSSCPRIRFSVVLAFVGLLSSPSLYAQAQIIELTATGVVLNGSGFPGVSNGDPCEIVITFDFASEFDFCVTAENILNCNQRHAPSSFRLSANGQELYQSDLFTFVGQSGPLSLGDNFASASTLLGGDFLPARSFVFSSGPPNGEAIGPNDVTDLESLLCGINYGRFPDAQLVSAPGGVAVIDTDFVCGNFSIVVRRDGEVCAQSTGGGGPGPGPAPSALAAALTTFIDALDAAIDQASAELNPQGSPRNPVQKALEKGRKGLASVQKSTDKEKILKALVAFSKFLKGIAKSPTDLLPHFATELEGYEELVGDFVQDAKDAIDEARQAIENLGQTVPSKLESKLAGLDALYLSLGALSPEDVLFFKVLKRLKYDKMRVRFEKAAAKTARRGGRR